MEPILATLIVFATPVAILATVFNYKLKRKALEQGGDSKENARLRAHCEELEARLQTLETIVCDGDDAAAARLRASKSAPRLEAPKP